MRNLILIGMPAVGKSTVGVVAAKRIGLQFIDTDLLIQSRESCLLKDIIQSRGIDEFLAIENEVNRSLDVDGAVIAPGGSVIYCKEAMEHFKKIGLVVYLRVSYETITARIENIKSRGVVLKEGQTLQQLYEERSILFEQYADVVIDEENLTMDQTIENLLEMLNRRGF